MDDIRWVQRLDNYRRALKKLEENIAYIQQEYEHTDDVDAERWHDISRNVQDIFKQGLIQSFEFTHELAWNMLKDFLEYQGNSELRGSCDTIRESLRVNLIDQGNIWMDMIQSRNNALYTYDEDIANTIFLSIINDYVPLFNGLEQNISVTIQKYRTRSRKNI